MRPLDDKKLIAHIRILFSAIPDPCDEDLRRLGDQHGSGLAQRWNDRKTSLTIVLLAAVVGLGYSANRLALESDRPV